MVMVADRAPLVRHCSACSSFCWSVTAVTDLSARAMVTDPSVVCRSFAPRPSDRPSLLVCPLLRLLVCLLARRCSSVADTLLVCLLVHHWLSLSCTCSWSLVRLLVHRSSLVRRWSVSSSITGPLLVHYWSITGPSATRASLTHCWSATRPSLTRGWSWSLVRLLVRRALLSRCSACLSITGLSARPLLSCLLFVHQSVCSSHGRWLVARPSAARRCSVYSSLTGLSIRVVVGSYRWSVCSLVTGPWVRVMSLVRLFGSWSLVCILDSSLAFSCVAGLPLVR